MWRLAGLLDLERLVMATIIEPLRAEWENVRAAAVQLGKRGEIDKARKIINQFHRRLCDLTVLDPACGSGNFLYVTLENLKRLEGEVLDFAGQFGESFKLEMAVDTVDPHQFLGLEINPRAAALAELVLWIGYLQWHFRTRGQTMPAEPVLKNFKNIQCRDAVLAYDGEPQPALDAAGNAKSVWDRLGKKTDTVTGREVPDETQRVPLLTYANPRPATWPEADFIVGNPPFIGNKRIRENLGDGYAETLRAAYPHVSESADFVLYWWHKAAELVRTGKARRFGLITTNSLRQTFARRVVQFHLNPVAAVCDRRSAGETNDQARRSQTAATTPLSLAFAIPDHPWVDTADGAAVRIAMTIGVPGEHAGELLEIKTETPQDDGSAKVTFDTKRGKISADLTIGANVSAVIALNANKNICFQGVILVGEGFRLSSNETETLKQRLGAIPAVIRRHISGKDVINGDRGNWVIDLTGFDDEASVRRKHPVLYQHLFTTVRPERLQNREKSRRDRWWLFGRSNETMRAALVGLPRFIATVETSKYKLFTFVPGHFCPDHKLYVIASGDAFHLGVLSSRVHVTYSLAAGGTLEDRPTWTNTTCFLPFPFPLCGEKEKTRIRELAEALDAHRKQVQAKHGVTLTGLYNVLEKIRAGKTLTEKEKFVHDRGLVSTLKSLHDDLDAAVSAAYGWVHPDPETGEQEPENLTDQEILERLVALNAQRAAEEARGVIHWLRPEYQAKGQQEIILESKPAKKSKTRATPAKRKGKAAWPKTLPERMHVVETALHAAAAPIAPAELAKQFARAKPADVAEILKTLETFGRARRAGEGRFAP